MCRRGSLLPNLTGYTDDSYPNPVGRSVWDKNTVCYTNPKTTSVGPVVFFDKK